LERRLDGGGHELRRVRVDDDVPAETAPATVAARCPAQAITAVSSMAATSPATPGTRSLRSPKSCTRPLMDTRVRSSTRASAGRRTIAENTSVP